MQAHTLFDVTADDVADTTDDYYTPRWIFDAAGLVFDMDVAAPVDPARRTCPARHYLTPLEDGLTHPWDGLVWMNPPFSRNAPWIKRFAEHSTGLALLATLRVPALGTAMQCADALALLNVVFLRPPGFMRTTVPFPMLLIARGRVAVDALTRVAAADKYLSGTYHVRPGYGRMVP